MSNNKLYDRLAQSAQTESMDFDQDVMWSSIESRLRKKRRPIGLILFLGLAVSGIAAALLIPSNFIASHQLNNDQTTLATKTDVAYEAKDDVVGENKIDEKSMDLILSEQMDESSSDLEPKLNMAQSALGSKIKTTNPVRREGSTQTKELTKNVNNINHGEFLLASDKGLSATDESPFEKVAVHVNPKEASASTPISFDKEIGIAPASMMISTVQQLAQHSQLLEIKTDELLYQPLAVNKKDWSRCDINNPWSFLVEGYGGYSFPFVKNESKNIDGGAYLSDWEDAHTAVGGFQGGLNLVVQSPGGFEVAAGFEYQQFSEKLESRLTITEIRRVWSEMAYYMTLPDGTRKWFADTVTTTVTTTEKRTTELRHRMYNVPIRVGYMAQFNDWNIGAHAGAIVHIDHLFDGLVLQPDGTYIEVNKSNQESVYKKNIGLSYTADLHIGRQVNDRTRTIYQA